MLLLKGLQLVLALCKVARVLPLLLSQLGSVLVLSVSQLGPVFLVALFQVCAHFLQQAVIALLRRMEGLRVVRILGALLGRVLGLGGLKLVLVLLGKGRGGVVALALAVLEGALVGLL